MRDDGSLNLVPKVPAQPTVGEGSPPEPKAGPHQRDRYGCFAHHEGTPRAPAQPCTMPIEEEVHVKARATSHRMFRCASFAIFAVTAGCGGPPPGEMESEEVGSVSSALGAPSDPLFRQQWALRNTGQTVPVADDEPELTGVAGVDIGI